MRRYEAKTRYKISKAQLELLLLILKFRFVSSDILAECLGKDRSTIYERLSVLVDQEYVIKKYDKTYRFRQRPVIYYLAPAGIRLLMREGFPRARIHYKNKDFTDELIDEQLLLGHLSRTIASHYSGKFKLLTKYEANSDDFYLTPPPFAKLVGISDSIPDYFIEYFPPYYESWKMRKRINQHLDYANDHDDYIYPNLLMICGNDSTLKRTVRMTADTYSDFDMFCTTKDQVLSGVTGIWLKPEEVDWDKEHECHPISLRPDN